MVAGSGAVRTSTEYFRFGNSSTRTGEKRGSRVAALIAFQMISSARVFFAGSIVPIQPRRSPAPVLIQTKQPARILNIPGKSSGGVMVDLVVTKVSTVRRASEGRES